MRSVPTGALAGVLAAAACVSAGAGAAAQTTSAAPADPAPFGPPVDDGHIWVHGLLDQFEARIAPGDTGLRWDGEAWVGPDEWRLWLKSEGELAHGQVSDGQTEVLVSKPISPFFDVQAGGRWDLQSGPRRGWAALGVEGLAPGFFTVALTGYLSTEGRLAAKARISYDQLLTNRLILQPEAELNLYSKPDPAEGVGAGVSDLDAGLRLRWEITRKFAPYVGVTLERTFGQTADFARAADVPVSKLRFTTGVRTWF